MKFAGPPRGARFIFPRRDVQGRCCTKLVDSRRAAVDVDVERLSALSAHVAGSAWSFISFQTAVQVYDDGNAGEDSIDTGR
jgi:hypothetical protein